MVQHFRQKVSFSLQKRSIAFEHVKILGSSVYRNYLTPAPLQPRIHLLFHPRTLGPTLHPGLKARAAYKASCLAFQSLFLSSASVAHTKSEPPLLWTISPETRAD
jgi:hypothetical protein